MSLRLWQKKVECSVNSKMKTMTQVKAHALCISLWQVNWCTINVKPCTESDIVSSDEDEIRGDKDGIILGISVYILRNNVIIQTYMHTLLHDILLYWVKQVASYTAISNCVV